MKTETREIYKCDHCNKLYQIKRFAIAHELMCFKNPDNYRPCLTCPHLKKRNHVVIYDTYSGEQKETVNLFYCLRVESFLYPPKVKIKKNWFDLGNELNEPMPKQCDYYDEEFRIDF